MFTKTQAAKLRDYFLLLPIAVMAILLFPYTASAGNGKYKNGKFSFCISVRFKATEAQLQDIRNVFQRASDLLSQATNGQHQIDKIYIVNAVTINGVDVPQASDSAEAWIFPGEGRAEAHVQGYGVRGLHMRHYYETHCSAARLEPGAHSIFHEFGHLVYGLYDEYTGPGGVGADCAVRPDTPTLSYCIMDNFYSRGGIAFGQGYTLNNFCVAANHDPDRNTAQSAATGGKSCWESIAAHPKYRANPPPATPSVIPESDHKVTFIDSCCGNNAYLSGIDPEVNFGVGFGGLRVMLVIDRSGSMDSEHRLDFAKIGAKQFVSFLHVGDAVGLVDFDDQITLDFPLTTITDEGVKGTIRGMIDNLDSRGSTDIGDALSMALGQITSQPERSCNEIIVLLTDGDHNTGTDPYTIVPKIKDEGVTVISVGLGQSISVYGQGLLSTAASETGGKYYRVTAPWQLLSLFIRLNKESRGGGLLSREPLNLTSGQTVETPIQVEQGSKTATFAVAIADSKDQVTTSLKTPSGTVINENSNFPNLSFTSDPNNRIFEVTSPEPGIWKVVITAGAISTGQAEINAFSENDGTNLTVTSKKDNVTFPDVMEVQATLSSGGINVTGASVSGAVTRPDGTSVPIMLYDDGLAIHGDVEKDDGVYSTRYSDYTKDGTYTFDLNAVAGAGAMTSGGEAMETMAPSNAKPVPTFTRSGSVAVVISGIKSTFLLSVTPNAQIIKAGSSSSFKVDVQSVLGFTSPVTLSAALTPPSSNITLNFASTTVVPGNSTTLTVNTATTTTPGSYAIAIKGTAGQAVSTITVNIDVQRGPSFAISTMTPSQTPRGVVPKKIIIKGSNIPPGCTVFFDSTPVTPTKLKSVKAVLKSLPPSLFETDRTISVKLVDPNGFFSNTLDFVVGTGMPPSVDLVVTPDSQRIIPGASAVYTIGINRKNYTDNVTLSISGLPLGASADFSPMTTTGDRSQLTISTSSSITAGSYSLAIQGTASGIKITPANCTLIVEQQGSVTLSASPPANTVAPGQSATYTVNINRNNFTGDVSLMVSGLPPNASAVFNPPSTTGNTSTLTVATTSSTAPGTYTLSISGSASGMTINPITVTLQVNAATQPTVRLNVNPSSQMVNAGQSASYTASLDRVNFNGPVDLTLVIRASAIPPGLSVSFTQDPVTGNSTTFTIFTTSLTPGGTYTFFIRGDATGATVENSQDFTLTVSSTQPVVNLLVTPGTRTIFAGQSADYTVTLNRVNFSGPVDLTLVLRASTVPPGLSVRFGSDPATGTSTVCTIFTTSATPRGTYTFYLRGDASGVTVNNSQDFTLVVQ